jgi:2-amino-4-hydroxy-6-hydroxymethyldihydropteridine diphosphokinase
MPTRNAEVTKSTYLIGIGSNQRTPWGGPRSTVASFLRAFVPSCDCTFSRRHEGTKKREVLAHSRIVQSRPIGPGTRTYANAVVMIESKHRPDALLKELKKMERKAGRRPGRRWGDRPLDLDIIAWSGGIWASPGLTIPHPEFRNRRFVLAPLCEIAPDWRDPVTHLTARHLLVRLDRKHPKE